MSRYVDEHRSRFGVEPICKTLGVSVSAYYQRRNGRRSNRAVEDERLLGRIRELHAATYYAYGCRVQRLMKGNEHRRCEAARQAVADDQSRPAGAAPS